MSTRTLLFRYAFLTVLLFFVLPSVSGWTFTNYSVTPSAPEIAPGTPVKSSFSVLFDSWDSGTTFDKDHSLTLFTDLAGAQWVVKKIEVIDETQPAVIETLMNRQGALAKVDGWSLSYVRKRFTITVDLTGNAPALNQSGPVTIVKVSETATGLKAIGSSIKKEKLLVVPTPAPTSTPELATPTPEQIPVTVPETSAPATPVNPTTKATYAPGPSPLLVLALLAGLVLLVQTLRQKR